MFKETPVRARLACDTPHTLQARLQAEHSARAVARRAKEEAKAREAAAAAAADTAAAKEEAEATLRRLQQQHGEQVRRAFKAESGGKAGGGRSNTPLFVSVARR